MAKMFNCKKTVVLSPLQEKIVILICEDIPLPKIATRLKITQANVYSTLKDARTTNKVNTTYGLIVRYLRSGYLTEF